MSDILTRLLLDTKDYDSKLGKAKKSSNDFASNMAGKVAASVGKFAAGIGIAMGGVEAFNKVMGATQTTGDLTRGVMQSLKTSVDEFFYSVNKGNLSSFIANLGDIAKKSKEAYAALDQLGNTQISYGVIGAQNRASIADAQYLAKNKFAPIEERAKAFGQWKEALLKEESNIETVQYELVNAVSKTIGSRLPGNIKVTLEDVIRAFEVYLLKPDSRTLVKSRAEMGTRNYEANAKRKDWTQEQKDALAESQRENLITYALLEKYTDEQLKDIATMIQQYYALTSAVRGLGREFNETANEFNNANKTTKGFNPIKSLSGYTVYSGNSEAGKNFTGGGTGGKKKIEFPVVVSQVSYDTPIGKKMLEYMNGKTFEPVKVPIEIEENIEEEDLAGKWAQHLKKEQKDLENFNLALSSTADIFGSLGSIAGSAGADFLAATMQSMGSVAQMILQLQALCTAQGVTSASKLPFPANIAAIATVVATIASVFSSLPKFEKGGIIGGSSFFGDKLLARVNSGEMILNQSQQAKLLAMTEGSNVRVSGDVRLSGKDIYIALHNYMAVSGKKL